MKNPITKHGFEQIEAELNKLVTEDREKIKVAIAEARALGDLKENAEYHAAKEKQGHIEGRIMELQGQIATAEIIDPKNITNDKVVFGATVTLLNTETDESVTYQLVGQIEADRKQGKISYLSPIGKSLLGKEEGDTVIVRAPKGDIEYEIESITYE